jgi:hypothetical protein
MSTNPTPAPLPEVVNPQWDAQYLSAQPPAVQQLMKMVVRTPADLAAKQLQAAALATAGYVILGTVMVGGWSASYYTAYMLNLGYIWEPSFGMPAVSLAPTLSQGSVLPYTPTVMPPGGILLTTNIDLIPSIYPAPPAA